MKKANLIKKTLEGLINKGNRDVFIHFYDEYADGCTRLGMVRDEEGIHYYTYSDNIEHGWLDMDKTYLTEEEFIQILNNLPDNLDYDYDYFKEV